ncbi:MAG: hypothetical protein AB1846_13000 [Chloroflexota bacterium]
MTTFSLPARQPFNFHNTVRSHGWYQVAPFHYDEAASLLTYVLRLSGGKVVELRLTPAPDGLQVETAALTEAEQAEVSERVDWMFGLQRDFSDFYAATRHEPKLAHVEPNAYGRVLRSPTFFEDVVRTILTTNTLWAATKRMTLNLVTQFGEPVTGRGSSNPEQGGAKDVSRPDYRKAFPTPERLAAASEEQLRNETRLGYRSPYLIELARRAASGELDIEAFKTSGLPTLELRKELMKIKGIGAYAAANLLMILGRPDFIPIDSWATKMVSLEWHDGQPVTPAEVESHFERWGQWKGMAYWFWNWSHQG